MGIAFPQGGQVLSPTVPGFTKGSLIAAIADVGVGQDAPIVTRMRWVESAEEGGVVADRCAFVYVFVPKQLVNI